MQLLVVFGIQQDFSEQKVHQLVDVLCAIIMTLLLYIINMQPTS